ncbi:MAG: DMT family transporter [Sphingomonadales bacterium]|jgi:S-adenosylmethionine uptake transporter
MSAAPPSRAQALLLVLAGIGALCVLDVLAKYLALRHGAAVATLGRYIAGSIIGLAVWQAQGRPWVAPGGLKPNVVRGTLIAAMALAFFWSISKLPMALVLTLTFIGPLTVPFMAALYLKEPLQPRCLAAGVIGFAGVLVTVGGMPRLDGDDLLAAGAAVFAAVPYGASAVILRSRAKADGATVITLIAALVPMLWLSPVLLTLPALPPLPDLGLMALMGLAGNIGVQLMARGYVHLEAQVSAVLEYSALPWAALFGWLVFGEAVATTTLLGAAIIAGACLWASRPPASGPAPAP